MKTINWIAVLFCICLSSCFNSKEGETTEQKSNEPKTSNKTEVKDDPKDDAAMENSNHLKFKGVPIDGTLDEFVSRMKRKGFRSIGSEDGMEILTGDFAAHKECTIYVSTLENKDLVSTIAVKFPNQETWKRLYGDYDNLKELLTEKYGQPSSVTEKFEDSYIDSDFFRIHAVKQDECKYETRYTTDKGDIVLWMEHDRFLNSFVMLAYKDKINGGIIKDMAIDDL